MSSTNHEAPHYAVFSSLLLLSPSYPKCLLQHYLRTPLACDRPGFTPVEDSWQNCTPLHLQHHSLNAVQAVYWVILLAASRRPWRDNVAVWLACGFVPRRSETLRGAKVGMCTWEEIRQGFRGASWLVVLAEYYSDGENKKNGACSTCVEEEHTGCFGGETRRKGTPEKLYVRWGILLKLFLIEWV